LVSLTLRQQPGLRGFERSALEKIFGPKRQEETEMKKYYDEELHDFYPTPPPPTKQY
jgi:hypothetical protein